MRRDNPDGLPTSLLMELSASRISWDESALICTNHCPSIVFKGGELARTGREIFSTTQPNH